MSRDMHKSVNQMRSTKAQLSRYAKLLKGDENATSLIGKSDSLMKRINLWEENLIQAKQNHNKILSISIVS